MIHHEAGLGREREGEREGERGEEVSGGERGGAGGDRKGEGGSGNGTLPEDTVSACAHLGAQVRRDTKHLTEAGIVHQVDLR